MSFLSSPVLVCHELSLISSSFVMRLAVSSGMEVRRHVKIYHDFVRFKFEILNFRDRS